MKKILIVLFSLLVMSCDIAQDIYTDINMSQVEPFDLYYPDQEFNSIQEIVDFIDSSLTYKRDGAFEFLPPSVSMEKRTGDCKAYALLFINLYYLTYGEKCSVALTNAIDPNAYAYNHCFVILPDGTKIDQFSGEVVDYKIYYIYHFDFFLKG